MDYVKEETVFGNKKIAVGDKLHDLVLYNLGRIYIQYGNKFKEFNEIIKSIQTGTGSSSNIIIEESGLQDISKYNNGSIIYDATSGILYLVYDKLFLILAEHVNTNSNKFVLKTGDTMTGVLTINTTDPPLSIKSSKLIEHLNSNYLEGHPADDFALKAVNETITGNWTFEGNNIFDGDDIHNGYNTFNGKSKFNETGIFDAASAIRIGTGSLITDGSMGSSVFVSGYTGTGWRLDADSNTLEIDNLIVRGILQVYELVVNKVSATNGSFWVTDAFEINKIKNLKYINCLSSKITTDYPKSFFDEDTYYIPYLLLGLTNFPIYNLNDERSLYFVDLMLKDNNVVGLKMYTSDHPLATRSDFNDTESNNTIFYKYRYMFHILNLKLFYKCINDFRTEELENEDKTDTSVDIPTKDSDVTDIWDDDGTQETTTTSEEESEEETEEEDVPETLKGNLIDLTKSNGTDSNLLINKLAAAGIVEKIYLYQRHSSNVSDDEILSYTDDEGTEHTTTVTAQDDSFDRQVFPIVISSKLSLDTNGLEYYYPKSSDDEPEDCIAKINLYYKYFGSRYTASENNIYILEAKENEYPVFRPGDILRCLKFNGQCVKQYHGVVCGIVGAYGFLIQLQSNSILNYKTEYEYDDEGNLVSDEVSYDTELYSRSAALQKKLRELEIEPESYNSEDDTYKVTLAVWLENHPDIDTQYYTDDDKAKILSVYLDDFTSKQTTTGPEEEDALVRIGSIFDGDRRNSLYLTSSENHSPYEDIMVGVNRPDFGVVYFTPTYKKFLSNKTSTYYYLQDIYDEETGEPDTSLILTYIDKGLTTIKYVPEDCADPTSVSSDSYNDPLDVNEIILLYWSQLDINKDEYNPEDEQYAVTIDTWLKNKEKDPEGLWTTDELNENVCDFISTWLSNLEEVIPLKKKSSEYFLINENYVSEKPINATIKRLHHISTISHKIDSITYEVLKIAYGCSVLTGFEVIEKNENDTKCKASLESVTKVRLGNLSGIYNHAFGKKLPKGYGLYADNVFLRGEFYLNNGKSMMSIGNDIALAVGNIDNLGDLIANIHTEISNLGPTILNEVETSIKSGDLKEVIDDSIDSVTENLIANNNSAMLYMGEDFLTLALGSAGLVINNPNATYTGSYIEDAFGNVIPEVDPDTIGDGDEFISLYGDSVRMKNTIHVTDKVTGKVYYRIAYFDTSPDSWSCAPVKKTVSEDTEDYDKAKMFKPQKKTVVTETDTETGKTIVTLITLGEYIQLNYGWIELTYLNATDHPVTCSKNSNVIIRVPDIDDIENINSSIYFDKDDGGYKDSYENYGSWKYVSCINFRSCSPSESHTGHIYPYTAYNSSSKQMNGSVLTTNVWFVLDYDNAFLLTDGKLNVNYLDVSNYISSCGLYVYETPTNDLNEEYRENNPKDDATFYVDKTGSVSMTNAQITGSIYQLPIAITPYNIEEYLTTAKFDIKQYESGEFCMDKTTETEVGYNSKFNKISYSPKKLCIDFKKFSNTLMLYDYSIPDSYTTEESYTQFIKNLNYWLPIAGKTYKVANINSGNPNCKLFVPENNIVVDDLNDSIFIEKEKEDDGSTYKKQHMSFILVSDPDFSSLKLNCLYNGIIGLKTIYCPEIGIETKDSSGSYNNYIEYDKSKYKSLTYDLSYCVLYDEERRNAINEEISKLGYNDYSIDYGSLITDKLLDTVGYVGQSNVDSYLYNTYKDYGNNNNIYTLNNKSTGTKQYTLNDSGTIDIYLPYYISGRLTEFAKDEIYTYSNSERHYNYNKHYSSIEYFNNYVDCANCIGLTRTIVNLSLETVIVYGVDENALLGDVKKIELKGGDGVSIDGESMTGKIIESTYLTIDTTTGKISGNISSGSSLTNKPYYKLNGILTVLDKSTDSYSTSNIPGDLIRNYKLEFGNYITVTCVSKNVLESRADGGNKYSLVVYWEKVDGGLLPSYDVGLTYYSDEEDEYISTLNSYSVISGLDACGNIPLTAKKTYSYILSKYPEFVAVDPNYYKFILGQFSYEEALLYVTSTSIYKNNGYLNARNKGYIATRTVGISITSSRNFNDVEWDYIDEELYHFYENMGESDYTKLCTNLNVSPN